MNHSILLKYDLLKHTQSLWFKSLKFLTRTHFCTVQSTTKIPLQTMKECMERRRGLIQRTKTSKCDNMTITHIHSKETTSGELREHENKKTKNSLTRSERGRRRVLKEVEVVSEKMREEERRRRRRKISPFHFLLFKSILNFTEKSMSIIDSRNRIFTKISIITRQEVRDFLRERRTTCTVQKTKCIGEILLGLEYFPIDMILRVLMEF